MNRLTGPLLYLRVWHRTKFIIDILIPASLAALVFCVRIFFYDSTGLLKSDGLLNLIIPLLGALAGFYIAALTAVSAFPITSLDNKMPGDLIRVLGTDNRENPTRRQFLSLQFGYLSFMSISLFSISVFSVYMRPTLEFIKGLNLNKFEVGVVSSWIALFILLFCIINLISVTLFSIYYLSDRIHQYEPKLQGGPDEQGPKVSNP